MQFRTHRGRKVFQSTPPGMQSPEKHLRAAPPNELRIFGQGACVRTWEDRVQFPMHMKPALASARTIAAT